MSSILAETVVNGILDMSTAAVTGLCSREPGSAPGTNILRKSGTFFGHAVGLAGRKAKDRPSETVASCKEIGERHMRGIENSVGGVAP